MVKVRVLHPSCSLGAAGELVEVSEGLAKEFASRGIVEVADVKEAEPEPDPKPKRGKQA